jgi:LPS O-antigen subunit length determinant protein (WzzB/FepE family)
VKCYNIIRLVQHNDYPMREWHLENMKKTIVKYVGGLSEDDAKSKYKMKLHRKYKGNLAYVRKSIDIDIRHGVTREEVTEYLDKILNDPSFSDIRKSEGSKERIAELQLK